MFGYIKPFVPELKVRENELYKAVYCGLCKSMGRGTRFYSRLSLSYDAVFLAFVLSALNGSAFEVYTGRCGLNPFRRKMIAKDNGILRYCAAVSAQLTYYSVLDKRADEKGLKKLAAVMVTPAARRMKKNAHRIFDFDDCVTERCLDDLHAAEADNSPDLDRAAECFGRLLSYYFENGAEESVRQSAAAIGMCVGRYIYTADACDDLESDEKSGAYNPLKYGEGEKSDRLYGAYGAMCLWADRAAGELTLEGRDGSSFSIAQNIMRLGMIDTAKNITSGDNKGRKHGRNGKRSV